MLTVALKGSWIGIARIDDPLQAAVEHALLVARQVQAPVHKGIKSL